MCDATILAGRWLTNSNSPQPPAIRSSAADYQLFQGGDQNGRIAPNYRYGQMRSQLIIPLRLMSKRIPLTNRVTMPK